MCYSGSMKLTNVLFYAVDLNRSTMTNKSPAGTPHFFLVHYFSRSSNGIINNYSMSTRWI